jgi:hypothetical protein
MDKYILKAFKEPGTYIIGDVVVRLRHDGSTSVHRSNNYRKQEIRESIFRVLEALFEEDNIKNNKKQDV